MGVYRDAEISMKLSHSFSPSRISRMFEELPVSLFLCGLVCVGVMVLVLGTAGNWSGIMRWGIIGIFAPFLVSGLLAYLVLARRTLSTAELQIAGRFLHGWLGLLTAWAGLLFWAGFSTIYYTTILAPPAQDCCIGYPALHDSVALIPLLMIMAGGLTAVFEAVKPRVGGLVEVASVSLLATMILTAFTGRPFYIAGGGAYSIWGGWPLAWWANSLGTCAGCNFLAGTALVAPFLLDWAFWGIVIGGILYMTRLRRSEQVPDVGVPSDGVLGTLRGVLLLRFKSPADVRTLRP